MLSISPSQSPTSTVLLDEDAARPEDMDHLLTRLRRNMVELILQGDDVTRQMWQMYSVFEEIFGLQKFSSKLPQKPVVVGDRLTTKQRGSKAPTLASPPPPSGTSTATAREDKNNRSVSSTSPTITTISAVTATSTAAITATATTTVTVIATTAATTATTVTSPSPTVSAIVTPTTTVTSSPTTVTSSPIASSDDNLQRHSLTTPQLDTRPFVRNKVNQRLQSPNDSVRPQKTETRRPSLESNVTSPAGALSSSSNSGPPSVVSRTSNPLLDTIGVLAGSYPDSDDSDLDMVYQQLRYRGKHRKPEQGRLRTQRSQRHHIQQFANSDPESTSYAGSNSIDSGYKSQCATPEVSDTLSASEVRRSAEDVSASDSSTTSGRPRSSDGNDSKSAKIKMGTRSIASKVSIYPTPRSPRYAQLPHLESSMTDVALDHLMYLRQSLRKDREDYLPSPSHSSMPSSSASSTVRDELSPTAITDEESSGPPEQTRVQQGPQQQQHRQSPLLQSQQHIVPQPFVPAPTFTRMESPPTYSPAHCQRKGQAVPRTERRLSAGNEIESHLASGGSTSPADYLLSGVEFYDLDSVHNYPQRRGYVAMVEEKTRCSRIHVMAAPPKRDVQPIERRPDPVFKKRKEPLPMSRTPPIDPVVYGMHRRASLDTTPTHHQHHHHHHPAQLQQQQQRIGNGSRGSDSKLTEAAIRVLEMIEDFRMEEALENASAYNNIDPRGRVRSSVSTVTTVGPHAFAPRFRHHSGSRSGMRPASTGSLMAGVPLDARSVASAASSYAASAEHHVYEEIMYDLVCERQEQAMVAMPQNSGTKPRNRLLPMRPVSSSSNPRGYLPSPELARMATRSHKNRSNLYEHEVRNAERYHEMNWNMPRNRQDSVPSDYPS